MAMKGKTVCYMHGGKSLAGLASPQFKHGRYSKYLPGDMLSRYQEALDDTELLSLRSEIALLDARLGEQVEGLKTGEGGQVWERLRATYQQLTDARQAGDGKLLAQALIELGNLIQTGNAKEATWGGIIDLFEQRRKLVESERKRLVEMQQFITAERAMALITAVIHAVSRHVPDRQALSAIAVDIKQLIDQPGG